MQEFSQLIILAISDRTTKLGRINLLANILQRSNKIVQYFSGDHNTIPVRTYLLRNANHKTSRILFQIQEECLTISDDFLSANNIVLHGFIRASGYVLLGCEFS